MLGLVKYSGVSQYSGIVGLRGRPPITAVLTTKRKEDFTKKHDEMPKRYWLVEPRQDDKGIRKLSSTFDFFNNAPEKECRTIRGIILHPKMNLCFHSNLMAQQLPAKYYRNHGLQIPVRTSTRGEQTYGHPNKIPCCVGDGRTATRWQGKNADDFEVIRCTNDRCEFRLGKPKWCKPHMTFLFAIRWEDPSLPSGIIRFDSASWNTASNFYGEDEIERDGQKVIVRQGFFGLLDSIARNSGVTEATPFGVPFVMNLDYEAKKDGNTTWVFPVTYIAPEFAMPPVKFFKEMRQDMKLLRDINPITVEEEIEREPSVLDIPFGPISIGSSRNGNETVIDVKLEPEGEKPPKTPNAGLSQSGASKESNGVEKSIPGKAGEAGNGGNGHTNTKLFPDNWATEREKKLKGIGKWRDLAAETLGNNILLKTKTDKESAWELYWRITAAKAAFEKIGAMDVWSGLTYGGDLNSIPLTPMKGDEEKVCIASVVAKLETRYRELKQKRNT